MGVSQKQGKNRKRNTKRKKAKKQTKIKFVKILGVAKKSEKK